MPGRKAPVVELSEAERAQLESWVRRPKSAQGLVLRAQIVLRADEGLSNLEIAAALGVHHMTVGKWRSRFARNRLEGLVDEPRSGAPRTISDEKIQEVIERTLDSKPADATHWSTRSMAKISGLSQPTIFRLWRAFGLQPHRVETFKLSKDPFFVEKVRDIVGLYLNPPTRAVVLCVDEKTQIQALDRTQRLLPMRPGQVERRSHDYERHGTIDLFAALDAKTGRVIGQFHKKHRAIEFRKFLDTIDATVPAELDVHLVLDNSTTHKTAAIKRWLLKRPRFHVHFTPTSASWINLVERWFGLLTEKQVRRGVHTSVAALVAAIRNFLAVTNEDPKPFVWTKTADEILASVERFCLRTCDSGH